MANSARRKGRLAFGGLTIASVIVLSACDREPVSPTPTEAATLTTPRSSLTPERARAIITSRKPLYARKTPAAPNGISYAIDDGLSIANEVGILEGTMGGEQLELLFRMDPSGTLVDRITMVSNGEQIYAANIVYNGDGTASEVTQTAYYHETAGPTRRDISDPAGWGPADMTSPLGRKFAAPIAGRFEFMNKRTSASVMFEGCDATAIAGIAAIVASVYTIRAATSNVAASAAVTSTAASVVAAGPCLRIIADAGMVSAANNANSLAAGLAINGVIWAINSYQTGTRVWDRLRRWESTGATLINDIIDTWNKAYSGSCNASSSTRACTSMMFYLMQ